MSAKPCPFCTLVLPGGLDRPFLAESAAAVAFEDAFPSAEDHTLIVPRRHVERVHELTATEHTQIWDLARTQLARLESKEPGDRTVGYTIGINDGEVAGQTVAHVHLHIIPRHAGDTAEPRGGLRWVIPATAKYWEIPTDRRPALLATAGLPLPGGDTAFKGPAHEGSCQRSLRDGRAR